MPNRHDSGSSHGLAEKHHEVGPRHGSTRRWPGWRVILLTLMVLLALYELQPHVKDWVLIWKYNHSHNFVRVP